jgi:hypothetical protein
MRLLRQRGAFGPRRHEPEPPSCRDEHRVAPLLCAGSKGGRASLDAWPLGVALVANGSSDGGAPAEIDVHFRTGITSVVRRLLASRIAAGGRQGLRPLPIGTEATAPGSLSKGAGPSLRLGLARATGCGELVALGRSGR